MQRRHNTARPAESWSASRFVQSSRGLLTLCRATPALVGGKHAEISSETLPLCCWTVGPGLNSKSQTSESSYYCSVRFLVVEGVCKKSLYSAMLIRLQGYDRGGKVDGPMELTGRVGL
jgi:hypothetical protein